MTITTATCSPVPMSDEDMTRRFKKFHVVTAGARALEVIADPDNNPLSFRAILVEMLRAQKPGSQQRTRMQRLKVTKLADSTTTLDKIIPHPREGFTAHRLARLRHEERIHGPSPSNLNTARAT